MWNNKTPVQPTSWQLYSLAPGRFVFQGNLRSQFPGKQVAWDMVGSWWIWSLGQDCFFMTFSLHLSVDSCADIDDYFRGSSTSWLSGSLLVGGQRTGLCVWECLQGKLETIQKWNGARFRCLQPKHFQSRINNTTFQLFTMNNNQLSVFKQFSKNNTNAGRASKLFYKFWADIGNLFANYFSATTSSISLMLGLAAKAVVDSIWD